MKQFLTRKVPEFICWNELDEHKYLVWPLIISMFAIYGLLSALNLPNPIIITVAFVLPISYYFYLILSLINNDGFPFDTARLGLIKADEDLVNSTTQVFRDRITFYLHKISTDKTKGMSKVDKVNLVGRIYDGIYARDKTGLRIYLGEIHICAGYLRDIEHSDVDVEFIRILIDKINPLLNTEDLNGLEKLNLIPTLKVTKE